LHVAAIVRPHAYLFLWRGKARAGLAPIIRRGVWALDRIFSFLSCKRAA
jgi:hypothetical protein